jgi:hypothetical protein
MKKIFLYSILIVYVFFIVITTIPDNSFKPDNCFYVYENVEKYSNSNELKNIEVTYYSISGLGHAAVFKDVEKDIYYHVDIMTLTSDQPYKQVGKKELSDRNLTGVLRIKTVIKKKKAHLQSRMVDVFSYEIYPLKFEKVESK